MEWSCRPPVSRNRSRPLSGRFNTGSQWMVQGKSNLVRVTVGGSLDLDSTSAPRGAAGSAGTWDENSAPCHVLVFIVLGPSWPS